MYLKRPTLEWKHTQLRVTNGTTAWAKAAVVCAENYGEDRELNEAQESAAKLMTPGVGMRFVLLFRDMAGALVYESESYYKPVGVSLVEAATVVMDTQFPSGYWPTDAAAGVKNETDELL